jgi:uncharacterized membrane protein
MRRNVSNVERVVSVLAGAALVGAGMKRQRAMGPAAATGLGLIARGVAGYCPVNHAIGRGRDLNGTREALGGSGGTRLRESIVINRPAQELFRFWRRLSNLPLFVRHLERVDEYDHGVSHWVMRGPAGKRIEWEAQLINEIEPDLLAWKSLPGADLVSAGSVRFQPLASGGTELTVTMQYELPAGSVGDAVSWVTGYWPPSELRTDLARLKKMFERGEIPAEPNEPWAARRAELMAT